MNRRRRLLIIIIAGSIITLMIILFTFSTTLNCCVVPPSTLLTRNAKLEVNKTTIASLNQTQTAAYFVGLTLTQATMMSTPTATS
jgi:hypothetical protein